MTLGQLIKDYRAQHNLSQAAFAQLSGISKGYVSMLENNKNPDSGKPIAPTYTVIEKVARVMGISVEEVTSRMGESGDAKVVRLFPAAGEYKGCPAVPLYNAMNDEGRAEYLRYGRALLDSEQYRLEETPAPIEYIRHYRTAAAAGYAAPIEGEDFELIPRDDAVPPAADFSIDIVGDSMEPYIMDGQRVYVQRDVSMQELDVGIFFVDGDVYCKQWCRSYDGSLYLLSANPKREDANVYLDRESGRGLVCFGKVILPRKLPKPVYE